MSIKNLKIEIHGIRAPKHLKKRLRNAILYLSKVVNHEEFEKRVISHSYINNGARVHGYHLSNVTADKVYEKIMAGGDMFSGADGDIDLAWRIKRASRRTSIIGFTTKDSRVITTYLWFINRKKPMTVAGHLMHEYLHNVGFEHEHHQTRLRPFTIPYAVGEITKKIAWGIRRGTL